MTEIKRAITFYETIKSNGELLDLKCEMDEDNWEVVSVFWNGHNVTNMLKCFALLPNVYVRGYVSLETLTRARNKYNETFLPRKTCPGITIGDPRSQHTFLYN